MKDCCATGAFMLRAINDGRDESNLSTESSALKESLAKAGLLPYGKCGVIPRKQNY
jgi:hypothetical protein